MAGYFLGGIDGMLIALLVLMTLDYINRGHVRHCRQAFELWLWASKAL